MTPYIIPIAPSPRKTAPPSAISSKNGGYFSIATGRAHRTFTPQIEKEDIPLNAPVVLSNGAAIYDYAEDRYLADTRLDGDAPAWLAQLCREFPDLGLRRTTARISTSTIPTP